LGSKLLGEPAFQPNCRLIVEFIVMADEAERIEKLILRELRHPDEQTATVAIPTGPRFEIGINLLPSAQIKITYAKVSS
jgi:hypothetical protein